MIGGTPVVAVPVVESVLPGAVHADEASEGYPAPDEAQEDQRRVEQGCRTYLQKREKKERANKGVSTYVPHAFGTSAWIEWAIENNTKKYGGGGGGVEEKKTVRPGCTRTHAHAP